MMRAKNSKTGGAGSKSKADARLTIETARNQTEDQVIDLVPSMMKLKRILVPIDFSPPAQKALRYALSFAEQFGARITLLNVVEPAVYPTELGYVPVEIDRLHKSVIVVAKQKLAAMANQHDQAKLLADHVVRVGHPYQEITQAAKELKADLI